MPKNVEASITRIVTKIVRHPELRELYFVNGQPLEGSQIELPGGIFIGISPETQERLAQAIRGGHMEYKREMEKTGVKKADAMGKAMETFSKILVYPTDIPTRLPDV